MSTFRRVLDLSPRHVLARYNLALVLKRADRMAEAIDELRRAIEIEPRAEAYYTLGVIYWHQGDLARATDALRSAVACRRSTQTRSTRSARCRGPTVTWQARPRRSAGRSRSGRICGPRITRSDRCCSGSGDEAGARTHLAEAERLRRRAQLDQEAGVWTATGTQRLEAGDATAALDHFRRAIQIFEAVRPGTLPDGAGAPTARPRGRGARGVSQSATTQPQSRPAADVEALKVTGPACQRRTSVV